MASFIIASDCDFAEIKRSTTVVVEVEYNSAFVTAKAVAVDAAIIAAIRIIAIVAATSGIRVGAIRLQQLRPLIVERIGATNLEVIATVATATTVQQDQMQRELLQ